MNCHDFARIHEILVRAEELCIAGKLELSNKLLETLEIEVRHLHYEVWLANARENHHV